MQKVIPIHSDESTWGKTIHSDESTWGKTEAEDLFNVTMGSWDGAKTCELVGSYISCP